MLAAASASCGGEGSGGSSSTSTSSSSGSGGHAGHGGGGSGMYTPQGCSFSIAARPEYKSFQIAPSDTAATPNIRRVRLGLGGNVTPGAAGRADPATSIGVAWQTDDGTFASEITWGPSPDPASWPAANRANGVTWLTPKGDLGGLDDQRMHEVYLCGLAPSTTYYYRVGGGPAGSEVWSEVYSFTTTPAAGASGAVKIGITGDSRGQSNDAWRLLQRRMSLSGVNLMLFSGDMVNLATDQAEWEKWLDNAWKDSDDSLLTSGRILTLATHGNHENHTSLFYGNVVLPQEPAQYPAYTELFYSVDVGPVHIVVVDDFWVGSSGDANYAATLKAWLDKDLDAANKNRASVPWIMAMHHHGEFSSSNHGQDADVLAGRAFFVPIWDQYHVDLVVDGHDHNYERTKPLTGPADNPTIQASPKDGTVYVVCAGSGAPAYSKGMSSFTEFSYDFKTTGIAGVYGYLTIDPAQIALEAHALATDGTDPIIDTLVINKP